MLFQSVEFLVLVLLAIAGVAILKRNTHQHWVLLALSYVFYGWWDVRFLVLILLTSTIDYAAGLGMNGVKLSRSKLVAMSTSFVACAAVFLGLNWPLVQKEGMGPFSVENFLEPSWAGIWPAVGALAVLAAAGPFIYAWFFGLSERARRRAFLITTIVTNLSILGFFKYFNFFTDSLTGIGSMLGFEYVPPALKVVLPVGISFYTFQSMSYVIDAYRKDVEPERSYIRYLFFVSYFPQLVAGPIIRPQSFLPSLNEPWKFRSANVLSGFHLMLNGFLKKVIVADNIAPVVDSIFSDPTGQPSAAIMIGAALFAVQIYCDFSGYSDIARGVSRMFGVEIPINFNYPYFSTSIIDFWRRWHISLSTWLRDYLYIPLGGGRVSPGRIYVNLMTTMVLGGLWHGASWNFVIWGAYQGGLLCINRLIRIPIEKVPALDRFFKSTPGTVLRWVVTMYFVLLGWLIFRVTNFDDLWYCMKKFVLFDGVLTPAALAGIGRGAPFVAFILAGVFALLHAHSYFRRHWAVQLDRLPIWLLPGIYAGLAVVFFFFWPSQNAAFIYFQF